MTLIPRLQALATDSRRATDMAKYSSARHYKPATESLVSGCEKHLGFKLPKYLRGLYLTVGNGGFGPGYGLLGISQTGAKDDLGRDLVAAYCEFKSTYPDFAGCEWPERLLPFCYYGDATYFCVDCTAANQPVLRFDASDMDESDPLATSLTQKSKSLETWLREWMGRMENASAPRASRKKKTDTKITRAIGPGAPGRKKLSESKGRIAHGR